MTSGARVKTAAEAATFREKLNSSAYSHYGATVFGTSGAGTPGEAKPANGLKRLFAAALLSSTSAMVLGIPGAAADPAACSASGPTTYTCSGTSTAPYTFAGDDIVVTGDASWNQDTTGPAPSTGANTAISVTGEDISAQNYGSITTGVTPSAFALYGGHHGLEVTSTTGWSYALNHAGATITTTAESSDGLHARSGSGNAITANDGTLKGYGTYSTGIYSSADDGDATAANRAGASIVMSGDYQTGLEARSDEGTATGTNDGSIQVSSEDYSGTGMTVRGSTVHATNNGTILVETAEYATGIFASSFSPATTNVTNNGTITVTSDGGDSTGIYAGGPTVYVTNAEGATIASDYVAIAVGYARGGEIVNSGDITGNVISGGGRRKIRRGATDMTVENTGTIDGMIDFRFSYNTHVVNDGGTVGNGTNAISVGYGDSVVDITGTGNDINGALVALDSSMEPTSGGMGAVIPLTVPEIHSTLNFSQDDTLTLDTGTGIANVAVAYFDEINFNSGTTVFSGTNVWSLGGEANIFGGATVTGDGEVLLLGVSQLNVSGEGISRGTLFAPAGTTIQVTGDAVFGDGGRLTVGIAGDGDAGKLLASGSVTFEEGSEIYADLTRGIELTPEGELLVARGGEGLTDNGLTVYDNSILYDFTSDQRDNELYLLVDRVLTALDATNNNNGRSNARSIANAIDKFLEGAPTDNPIVRYLSQFPVEEQEAQLYKLVQDSLPSEANSDGNSTIVTSDLVLDLIMDRLEAGGFGIADAGGDTGVAAGDTFLGGDYKLALWGRIGGATAEYTPSGINGFDSNTFAGTVGVDGEFMPNLRAGLAVFYTRTDVDENGAGANSSQTIDSYGASLYGNWRPGEYYVSGSLGFGLNNYDSTRYSLGGANVADYDGTQFMARIEGGRTFTYGKWEVTPQAGVRFNYVSIDGYTETGPLPTTVNGQDITSVRGMAGVGLRYEEELGDGAKLIPEFYLRGLEELADPNEAITGAIVGGGSFVSQSEERDRFSLATGAGLTYELDGQMSVRLLYDGEFQSDYQEHALTAAIRFEF